jgi:hypothetical protein
MFTFASTHISYRRNPFPVSPHCHCEKGATSDCRQSWLQSVYSCSASPPPTSHIVVKVSLRRYLFMAALPLGLCYFFHLFGLVVGCAEDTVSNKAILNQIFETLLYRSIVHD